MDVVQIVSETINANYLQEVFLNSASVHLLHFLSSPFRICCAYKKEANERLELDHKILFCCTAWRSEQCIQLPSHRPAIGSPPSSSVQHLMSMRIHALLETERMCAAVSTVGRRARRAAEIIGGKGKLFSSIMNQKKGFERCCWGDDCLNWWQHLSRGPPFFFFAGCNLRSNSFIIQRTYSGHSWWKIK